MLSSGCFWEDFLLRNLKEEQQLRKDGDGNGDTGDLRRAGSNSAEGRLQKEEDYRQRSRGPVDHGFK